MVGAGEIALSSVEQLRTIGQVSPPLLDALIAYLADGNQWAAERLAREPGWVLDAALRGSDTQVFAEHLTRVDARDVTALKLGKKTEALYERAAQLTRQLDRYSYGADVRFADVEVDQARAAGVAIEFDRGAPLIVDRSLYRVLVKEAVARTVTELEARVADRAAEKQAQRRTTAELPSDPAADARRDEQRAVRAIAERAHGVNLDIGAGLLNGLATADPADMTVARFFALGLLGGDYDQSPYTQTGERVTRLATSGIRLVIDEFRSDVTKTRNYPDRPVMPTWLSPAVDSVVGAPQPVVELVGITGQGRRNATRVSELGTVADGLCAVGWSVGSIWCQAIGGMLCDA